MQVCVYLLPAISRIRPGTAVERRSLGLDYPVPAISRIRSGTAVDRRYAGLCVPDHFPMLSNRHIGPHASVIRRTQR